MATVCASTMWCEWYTVCQCCMMHVRSTVGKRKATLLYVLVDCHRPNAFSFWLFPLAKLKQLKEYVHMLKHTCTLARAHTCKYTRTCTVVACVCRMHMYMQEIGCDVIHVSYVDRIGTRFCQAGWELLCWGDEILLIDFFLVATDESRK